MLNSSQLKKSIHLTESILDRLLLVLLYLNKPAKVNELKEICVKNGFKIPANTNISLLLIRSKKCAIRLPEGWEITDAGVGRLSAEGLIPQVPAHAPHDLRKQLDNIANSDIQEFVLEAVKCLEAGLYRSSIVMSWISAVGVLHQEIIQNHLPAFNAEMARIDVKWKTAKTADDLGLVKESVLLDRLVALSIIGKNVKIQLQKCLDLRNGCGHPNSLKVGLNATANHLEILLLNVFNKFKV